MTRIIRKILPACTLCAGLCFAACGDSTTAPSTTSTSPTTETFGSQLGVNGWASHSFTVSQAGAISVTLASISPPDGVVVGLGIGVAYAGTIGCALTTSVEAAAGSAAQIEASVDTGSYCVKIYDIGNLTATATFSLSIVHP